MGAFAGAFIAGAHVAARRGATELVTLESLHFLGLGLGSGFIYLGLGCDPNTKT